MASGASRVPRILVLLNQGLLREMMTPENRALLDSIGMATLVPLFGSLRDPAYASLFDKVDAVVAGWGMRALPEDLLERAPNLRIIALAAESVRAVPKSLLERGVIVTTARSTLAPIVAEMALDLMIAGLRGLRRHTRDRQGTPLWEIPSRCPRTLFEQRVGLVGFGRTARCLRELLRPFRCRVSVYDPHLPPGEADRHQVTALDLGTLLCESTVVSIHAPGLPETRGMIGPEELRLMADGSLLVNTARGYIVDMDALTRELLSGRLAAALDTTDPDPLPEGHPLWNLPNVLVYSRIAGPTEDRLPATLESALISLRTFFEGQVPPEAVAVSDYDRSSF